MSDQFLAGCCSACQGTGGGDCNGLCWDCRGTGHAHPDDIGCDVLPLAACPVPNEDKRSPHGGTA